MAKQGFPKSNRLLSPLQYGPVFQQPDCRVSNRYFLILAKSGTGGQARLGIVVGKKHVSHAVQRNRIKRLVRESFRSRKQAFADTDMVVLARKGADSFDNPDILDQLRFLLDELVGKLD